jgi:hypothetical protein
MSASHARAVFERYLTAVNAGDADALDEVLHPDFQDFSQSGERTRGVENLKHIMRNYPGGYEDLGRGPVFGAEDRWVITPMFTLLRIEGTGSVFTGVQKARYPGGEAESHRAAGKWRAETRPPPRDLPRRRGCRDPLRQ